jgi:hypothetical protein
VELGGVGPSQFMPRSTRGDDERRPTSASCDGAADVVHSGAPPGLRQRWEKSGASMMLEVQGRHIATSLLPRRTPPPSPALPSRRAPPLDPGFWWRREVNEAPRCPGGPNRRGAPHPGVARWDLGRTAA